jgi:hypothetical protein
LGQYFASSENSVMVAQTAVQFAQSKLAPTLSEMPHFLLVEPSCGHGDIVLALMERLVQANILPTLVTIVGYDIDPHAIATCRQHKEFCKREYFLDWRHQNFVETNRQSLLPHGFVTVCLGGPPYTTGAGSGQDMQRDLPTRFLLHCLTLSRGMATDCIAFLLPKWYQNDNCSIKEEYRCKTVDLESFTFYFGGREMVTQPSVLQIYHRVV